MFFLNALLQIKKLYILFLLNAKLIITSILNLVKNGFRSSRPNIKLSTNTNYFMKDFVFV